MKKKVNYTPGEQRLVKIIVASGHTTTAHLMAKFYAGEKKKPPFHARATFIARLDQLIRKVDHNQEDFRIIKGERRGPYATEIWIRTRRGAKVDVSREIE